MLASGSVRSTTRSPAAAEAAQARGGRVWPVAPGAARPPPLALLAVMDAGGMIVADPLAPAVQVEPVVGLVAGAVGVPHKPEMGVEAGIHQGLAQAADARGDAVGSGLVVGTFKSEQMEWHRTDLRGSLFPQGIGSAPRVVPARRRQCLLWLAMALKHLPAARLERVGVRCCGGNNDLSGRHRSPERAIPIPA
jgi:hypothetical protein